MATYYDVTHSSSEIVSQPWEDESSQCQHDDIMQEWYTARMIWGSRTVSCLHVAYMLDMVHRLQVKKAFSWHAAFSFQCFLVTLWLTLSFSPFVWVSMFADILPSGSCLILRAGSGMKAAGSLQGCSLPRIKQSGTARFYVVIHITCRVLPVPCLFR